MSSQILNSDVFNKVSDVPKPLWRNLPIERKLELLDIFFENYSKTSKNIETTTITMIKESLNQGKLKLKKEIEYDKVNEKILNIHALVLNELTDNYIYKPELLNKKERKNVKNILFRN